MPRRSPSSSAISCIARTLGAPDSVPAGKTARSASSASRLRPDLRFDVADQVLDVAEALDLGEAADLDAARASNAAKVVARQVDEHHVLGAFLSVGDKFPGESRVGSGSCAARSRPGNWVRQHPVALYAQEEFRAGSNNFEIRHTDEEQVRAGADAADGAVQVDATDFRVYGLPAADHDLDGLARRDRLFRHADSRDVGVAIQALIESSLRRLAAETVPVADCGAPVVASARAPRGPALGDGVARSKSGASVCRAAIADSVWAR